MPSVRTHRRSRLLAGIALAAIAAATAACDSNILNRSSEDDTDVVNVAQDHGPCLPTLGDGVQSVGMSGDGRLVAFLSDARPLAWPEGQSWLDEHRAVYVLRDTAAGEAISATFAVVVPWPAGAAEQLQSFGRDEYGRPVTAEPVELPEVMHDIQLSQTGDRLVVSVARTTGVATGLAKLYSGIVTAEETPLAPGSGLELVGVNDSGRSEGISSYLVSPDGSRLVAIVGADHELRGYDFAQGHPVVYALGDDGGVIASNELPEADTSLDRMHSPAHEIEGTVHFAWSPDSNRVAIGRSDNVGVTSLSILDFASGTVTPVRTFVNSTVPFAQWSSDGQSLFVLTTELTAEQGSAFGHSDVRRIEAAEGGKPIGDSWRLEQKTWYRTAPSDLTSYGDDRRFVLIWESKLWLLETPEAGQGAATYGPLTLEPPDMSVTPGNRTGMIGVAAGEDIATFLVMDRFGSHVGQRLYASEEVCPLQPADAGEGTPAAPPAEEGAPAAPAAGEATVMATQQPEPTTEPAGVTPAESPEATVEGSPAAATEESPAATSASSPTP